MSEVPGTVLHLIWKTSMRAIHIAAVFALASASSLPASKAAAESAATAAMVGAGAMLGATTCLKHKLLCGAVLATGAAIGTGMLLNKDATPARDLDKARKEEAEGDINPPGFCHEDFYDKLNSVVDDACKHGTVSKCTQLDSKLQLGVKALVYRRCAAARKKREDACFKGGNEGHLLAIKQMWDGYNTCMRMSGLMQ